MARTSSRKLQVRTTFLTVTTGSVFTTQYADMFDARAQYVGKGRDSTTEFEDVGHSNDARSKLDTLVIGIIRTSDDEIRPPRPTQSKRKSTISAVTVSRAKVYDWINDNLSAFRKVGTLGFGGVFVVGTAIFIRRYGASLFSWRRR